MRDHEGMLSNLLKELRSAHGKEQAPEVFRGRLLKWADAVDVPRPSSASARRIRVRDVAVAVGALALAFVVPTIWSARSSIRLQPEVVVTGHDSPGPAGDSAGAEISGVLVRGTLSGSGRPPCSFRFLLEARAPVGRRLWVHYAGCTLPDTLSDATRPSVEVTARGYLQDGHWEATSVLSR